MDPERASLRTGVLPGAAIAASAAFCLLAANRRTITPASSALLLAWWTLAGALAGAAIGWLGGRSAIVLGWPAALVARPFAVLLVGRLLLPAGLGEMLALVTLLLLLLRRRLLPRNRRLDAAFALGLAALAPSFVSTTTPGLPPPLEPAMPLAAGSPAPGSVPVTVSVHTERGYPELPAVHVRLRELASESPGVRAALWSGRIPARTRAGTGHPVLLPGGGGISRTWDAVGIRALLALFPHPTTDGEAPFAITGTLAALAQASGIPVLRGVPAPDDPPHFLRILDAELAPDLETARGLRAAGAWIDVTLDAAGGGRLALAGTGLALGSVDGTANVVDVTPTALHLLGLAIPRSCDGRVLVEVMDPAGPAARPLRYRALGRFPAASASTTPR